MSLLERWQDLRREGVPATAAQVCADCPELAADLEKFAHFAGRIDLMTPSAPSLPGQAPDTAPFSSGPLVVPGYEILGLLGRGGMGVVYRARHLALNRLVALKVLLTPAHAGQRQIARFRREAQTLASLQHPHVVQIFDVGAHDDCPYLAMELVEGPTLESMTGPLPPHEAAGVVRLLARAVAHAHSRGVIHRDLKPANVLLAPMADEPALNTPLGCPKVADFGLARGTTVANERLTHSGVVMGTPAYLAPEQAMGSPDVGPAADVYALGAILYRLLAGREPFDSPSLGELLVLVSRQPPPPLPAHVPEALAAVCLRCLAKSPGERPTAQELATQLEGFLSPPEPPAPPKRRRRMTLVLAALAGMAVLASCLALLLSLRGERRRGDPPTDSSEVDLPPPLDDFQWSHPDRVAVLGDARLKNWGTVSALTYSPDGRLLATTGGDHVVRLWKPDSGEQVLALRWSENAGCSALSFHPRGSALAAGLSDGTVRLWDLTVWRGGKNPRGEVPSRSLPAGHGNGLMAVAFSADGESLVSGGANGVLRWWDPATGKLLRTAGGGRGPISRLLFVRKGEALAVIASASGGHTLTLWDSVTRKEIEGSARQVNNPESVACSADGKLIVQDANSTAATVFDLAGQELLKSRVGATQGLALSPDGKVVASGDVEVYLWDASTSKKRATLDAHCRLLAFSPDGKTLATASPRGTGVRLWDVARGAECTPGHGPRGEVTALAFAPDGSGLAFCGSGTLRVWDLPAARERFAPLPTESGSCLGVCFTDGGKSVVSSWAFRRQSEWATVALVHDASTGREKHPRVPIFGEVRLFCSPYGRLGVVADAGTLRLMDVVTQEAKGKPFSHDLGHVLGVAFGPGGVLAVAGYGGVRAWDGGGTELALEGMREKRADSVAFSPDGRILAVGIGQHARLLDVESGKELGRAQGYQFGGPRVPAFTADGRHVATCDSAGNVIVWSVPGCERKWQARLPGSVAAVAFASDGRHLATANPNGTVFVFRLTLDGEGRKGK